MGAAVMVPTVVVVTGAAPLDQHLVARVPSDAVVIAADSGVDYALAAGLVPTVAVGDFDSISPEGLAWAEQDAVVHRHGKDKDQTDTQLALDLAVGYNPDRLVLFAGAGDRLDHTMAAIGALGDPALTSIPVVEGWWGDQRLVVQHGPGEAVFHDLPIGSTVSLLATHGTCSGVSATGLKWPLSDFTLEPMSGRGISNEVVDAEVRVRVRSHVLTIMFPGATATAP